MVLATSSVAEERTLKSRVLMLSDQARSDVAILWLMKMMSLRDTKPMVGRPWKTCTTLMSRGLDQATAEQR